MKSLVRVFLILVMAVTALPAAEPDWGRRLSLYRRARDAYHRGNVRTARLLYQQAARIPAGTPELQRRAVERLNYHRMLAMLVPVMPDRRIERAARAHAVYLDRNTREGALSLVEAHEETRGRSGFTGKGPGERIRRQGFEGGASEAISSVIEPEEAVDHLVNSVYHRSALFRQDARYLGFGVVTRAVINLAWEREQREEGDVWYYPGAEQVDVPPEFPGGETPDPLPGAEYPVGSPLSIGTAGGMPVLEWARLEGPTGSLRLRVLGEDSAPRSDLMGDFLYLFPEQSLAPDTRYRARARVRGPDGKRRQLDWHFTTGSETPGVELWEVQVTEFVHTPEEVSVGTRVRFRAKVQASHPDEVRLRWTVDGKVLKDGTDYELDWTVPGPGDHEIRATGHYGEEAGAKGYQVLHLILGDGPSDQVPLSELRGRDPEADLWAVRILEFAHEPARFRRGEVLTFRVRFESTHPEALRVRWLVDGRTVQDGEAIHFEWPALGAGVHRIEVEGYFPGVDGAYARGRIDIHL